MYVFFEASAAFFKMSMVFLSESNFVLVVVFKQTKIKVTSYIASIGKDIELSEKLKAMQQSKCTSKVT